MKKICEFEYLAGDSSNVVVMVFNFMVLRGQHVSVSYSGGIVVILMCHHWEVTIFEASVSFS